MTAQLADDLRAARKLIERPEAWTKKEEARDSDGNSVGATSDYATCWCSLGAVERVCGGWNARYVAAELALADVLPKHSGAVVWEYNDAPTTTHADILALFDRAIAAAEGSAR